MNQETLPTFLEKTFTDSYHYLVGLRSGAVFTFTEISQRQDDWIHLADVRHVSGVPGFNGSLFGERGMDVRISEISFIMDATS